MEDLECDLESTRVLCAAAATIAASVVAVLAVRKIALRVLRPDPAFDPLHLAPPIVDTVLCTVVAVFVFVRAFYPHPVQIWRRVAT